MDNSQDNPQFSSDKSGDPLTLAAEARASEEACVELQRYLMTNPDFATMGSRAGHPLKPIGSNWTPPGSEGE